MQAAYFSGDKTFVLGESVSVPPLAGEVQLGFNYSLRPTWVLALCLLLLVAACSTETQSIPPSATATRIVLTTTPFERSTLPPAQTLEPRASLTSMPTRTPPPSITPAPTRTSSVANLAITPPSTDTPSPETLNNPTITLTYERLSAALAATEIEGINIPTLNFENAILTLKFSTVDDESLIATYILNADRAGQLTIRSDYLAASLDTELSQRLETALSGIIVDLLVADVIEYFGQERPFVIHRIRVDEVGIHVETLSG